MSIKLRWLGSACFEIILPSGKVLIINPYLDLAPTAPTTCEEVTGADYIFVGWGNMPSVSDVGPLVKRFNSKVLCSFQIAEPLEKLFGIHYQQGNVIAVTAGNILVFDDLKVEVVKAEHPPLIEGWGKLYQLVTGKEPNPDWSYEEIKAVLPPIPTNPARVEFNKKLMAAGVSPWRERLNFIFQTSDNLRIYLFESGPYDFLRYEVEQAHANVLIVQLGGNDPEKIAEFAAISGAEVVIPSRHDMRGPEVEHLLTDVMGKRLAELSTACFAKDLVRGKWYEIGIKVSAI